MRLRLLLSLLSVLPVFNLWADGVPVGTIIAFGGSNTPAAYLICDGGHYSISGDYSNLFSVIGYNFGSWLGTSFRVPNLKTRFPVGAEYIYQSFPVGMGGQGGSETVILGIGQIPSHTHQIFSDHYPAVWYVAPQGTYANALAFGTPGIWEVGYVGGGFSHSNMPPYLVVNYIIKALPDADASCTNAVSGIGFDDLNEALMWRNKIGLWIFGGICGLVCSVCFFARS